MILNLTQHNPTPEQVAAGVEDHPYHMTVEAIRKLLTFEDLPSSSLVTERARELAVLAYEASAETVLIGGAPFLMAPLERELNALGIDVLYAFSRRESLDIELKGGGVRKTSVFRHVGFVGVDMRHSC